MAWHTVLCDLQGTPISELAGAKNRRCAIPVASMATAGAQVSLAHPDADRLLDCSTVLKVYESLNSAEAARAVAAGTPVTGDGRILQFVGRQVTAEETGAAGAAANVAATWADPFWTLLRRLCGKSVTGYSRGTAVSMVDPGLVIISELVAATNAESPSGLVMGNVAASTSTYVSGWFYKPIGEAIAELGATLFGPDWRVRPIEPVATAGALATIGVLDVLPVIGQAQAGAVFEYGDGLLNVGAYKRGVTLEGSINRAFHLPPGFPDNAAQMPFVEDDTTSQARRGLLELVVQQDLSVDDLRRKLLQHHIAVRATPRQTMTFDPVRDPTGSRVPRLGIDFNAGDVLPFRASVAVNGTMVKRIDASVRVYQYAVNIGDDGSPTPQLTVTPS